MAYSLCLCARIFHRDSRGPRIDSRVCATVLEGKPHPRNNTSPLFGAGLRETQSLAIDELRKKSERWSRQKISFSVNDLTCAEFRRSQLDIGE
jgi:hypothetical protein